MRQTIRTGVFVQGDYFPAELRRLCESAARESRQHAGQSGYCVACRPAWPCQCVGLVAHNLALL